MMNSWIGSSLNALALGSCVIVIIPIITLGGMIFPWRDGLEELQEHRSGQMYVPIGTQAQTGGSEEFHETTYLVLPVNVTAVVRKESNTITYEETPGGLYSNLAGFLFFVLLFFFFGLPRMRTMWRGAIHPLTGRREIQSG